MAHPGRLERPACGFEVRRSIQLSYGCISPGVSEGIRTPDRWSHNPELYRLSYAHQNPAVALPTFSGDSENGTPRRIRTSDPLLRRQMLYPSELWAQTIYKSKLTVFPLFTHRGGCSEKRRGIFREQLHGIAFVLLA
jgi:hypothetical protein